ncbi:MAG: four helix bundle protein [Armatimonadota bacterium]|nr:four helix bundle protein [Armatimonadota bacterium]
MPLIERFENIHAWQEARKLTQQIYRLSALGPFAQDFELRDQIRRAGISTMANIAEGFDCDSNAEFARFLGYARRSAVEVQALLYVALDAGYSNETTFQAKYAQAAKTKGLIGGFMRSLAKK